MKEENTFVAYSLQSDTVLYKGIQSAEALAAIARSKGAVTLKQFDHPDDGSRAVLVRETLYVNGMDSGIPSTCQVYQRGDLEALVDFAEGILNFPDYTRKR